MANSKSQQIEVVKNSELCLNKYNADIVSYGNGFNKKNSPLLGGAITNVYDFKKENIESYNSDGNNEAYVTNKSTMKGLLFVNDDPTTLQFNKESVSADIIENSSKYFDYFDTNTHVHLQNTKLYVNINSSVSYVISNISNIEFARYFEKGDSKFYVLIYTAMNASGRILRIFKDSSYTTILNENLLQTGVLKCNMAIDGDWFYILINEVEAETQESTFKYGAYALDTSPFYQKLYMVNAAGIYAKVDFKCTYNNNDYILFFFIYGTNIYYYSFRTDAYSSSTTYSNTIIFPFETNNSTTVTIKSIKLKDMLIDPNGHTAKIYTEDGEALSYIGTSGYKIKNFYIYKYKSIFATVNNDQCTRLAIVGQFDGNLDSLNNSRSLTNGSYYMYYWQFDTNTKYEAPLYTTGNKYIFLRETDGHIPKKLSNFCSELYDKSFGSTNFRLLSNYDGTPSGISYKISGTSNGGILLSTLDTISFERNVYCKSGNEVLYFDAIAGYWVSIKLKEEYPSITVFNNYVLANYYGKDNAYSIKHNGITSYALDYNNRFLIERDLSSNTFVPNSFRLGSPVKVNSIEGFTSLTRGTSIKISSVANYKNLTGVESSQFADSDFNGYSLLEGYSSDNKELNFNNVHPNNSLNFNIQIFIDGKYYISAFEGATYLDSKYIDINYESSYVATMPVTAKILNTNTNKTFIKYLNYSYLLRTDYDQSSSFLYSPNSQVDSVDALFAIQGQLYGLLNSKIIAYTLDNYQLTATQVINAIPGLRYCANTLYEAYFWSDMEKALYVFTADNAMNKVTNATEISDIKSAVYIPAIDSVAFATNIGILVLNKDFGIFTIDDDTESIYTMNKGKIVTYDSSDDTVYYYSFFNDENYNRNNVIFSTKYYGAGSNIISINDCWYLRLYADKSEWANNREGSITLSVNALTDQGFVTEKEKKIDIKESDWDKLTDTLYIRYQPKLQRAIGISLNVDSSFPVAYIGVGTVQETTQMSRPSMQV